MRSLAYGPFTDAQVSDTLRDPDPQFGTRFEILDRRFNVVGELDTVESAVVEHSVDRDHKGALTLTMGAYEGLRDQMLRFLIRPYLQVRMPGQQWVEYPMGAYLWVDPERDLPSLGAEEWRVTLVDQTWRLSAASPGPAGFLIRKGQRITDVIRDIYRGLGYEDLSGIAESDETITDTKWFVYLTPNTPEYGQRHDLQQQLDSIRRDLKTETDVAKLTELSNAEAAATSALLALNDTAPPTDETFVSWGAIIALLSAGIGYQGPTFDWSGERPLAAPARDLATEGADHHYVTDDRSILESLSITPDFSAVGNRVFVKATNVDGLYGMVVADANDLYPNHPLAQKYVEDYIDVPIEDSTAGTSDALQARANAELGVRLAKLKNVNMTVGLNPAHDPYDLVGVTWSEDPDFGEETIFTQRSVKFDLDTQAMELGLGLVIR
jgi:hypothetical protein